MELLGDVGHVESRFNPFGVSVSFNVWKVHGLRRPYHRLRNCFECTGWYSWVTRLKWKLVLVHLETVLASVQDRCTVCAKCIIALEIILDTLDGTPRWRGSNGSSFLSVWILLILRQDSCTVCTECTVGSEIILNALDGTPRWCGSCRISFRSFWR
jgi:hypothetical protein